MKIQFLKFRAWFLTTGLGKFIRRWKHYFSYKEADAYKIVEENWPEATAEEKKEIVADMMVEARKYDFSFDEYIFHLFRGRPQEERREYISIKEGAK